MFFSNLEIDRMVQGVVRQHPPIRLAPHSCHLFASNSKLFSPTRSGCCQDQKTRSKLQESKYEVQSFLMLNYLQFTSIIQFFSEICNILLQNCCISETKSQKFSSEGENLFAGSFDVWSLEQPVPNLQQFDCQNVIMSEVKKQRSSCKPAPKFHHYLMPLAFKCFT